jgi:hypothetical protein
MQEADLTLIWWAASIVWSIAFLIVVSLFLYLKRKGRVSGESARGKLSDFVFVFVLVGLLALYIATINRASSLLFAVGNIVVEAILVVYTMRNKTA